MTRLSIRVGGRQRISHASSFHFIPRRVEASPLPCLASEGGSSGFSVAVKGMADTRRYFADFPGKLCRREAEFPHPRNTLIEPRLSNGRIE